MIDELMIIRFIKTQKCQHTVMSKYLDEKKTRCLKKNTDMMLCDRCREEMTE